MTFEERRVAEPRAEERQISETGVEEKKVEQRRRRNEYADNDGLGRQADYGLKRRYAQVRFFAIVGLIAVVALVVALWLFGQALALASLPALLILAALGVAALIFVTAEGRDRWLALTPLAFAAGLLPNALFLIVYNLAANLGGHGDVSYLPTLWAPVDVYEDAVLRLQERTQTWFRGAGLIVCILVCCAVLAGCALASLRAIKFNARARIAVGVGQAVVLGLITTTIFSQLTIGRWSPGAYSGRLYSDLAWVDQARTQTLIIETMTRAVRADAPTMRESYGPTIRAASETLASQPSISPAAADQLGWDYAAAVGRAATAQSGIERVDPGPPADRPTPFADRPAVLAAERAVAVEKARFDTALSDLARATADALGPVTVGAATSPSGSAFVDAFGAGLIDTTFEQIGARFDLTFGFGLAERLQARDSAPDHPLSQAVARYLVPTLLPEDQRQFDPAAIAQTLAAERGAEVHPPTPLQASFAGKVAEAMKRRAG
jgi:hypothetical protein